MQMTILTLILRKYPFQRAHDQPWQFKLLKHQSGSKRDIRGADDNSNISFEKIPIPEGARPGLAVLVIKTSKCFCAGY